MSIEVRDIAQTQRFIDDRKNEISPVDTIKYNNLCKIINDKEIIITKFENELEKHNTQLAKLQNVKQILGL